MTPKDVVRGRFGVELTICKFLVYRRMEVDDLSIGMLCKGSSSFKKS